MYYRYYYKVIMSSKISKRKTSLEKWKQFNDNLEELLKDRQNEILSTTDVSDFHTDETECKKIQVEELKEQDVQFKMEELKRQRSAFFEDLDRKMREEDRQHNHSMQIKKLEAELEECISQLERIKATDSVTRRKIREKNDEIERLRTALNSQVPNQGDLIDLNTILATLPAVICGVAELIRAARH